MDEKGTSMDYDGTTIDDNVCEKQESNVSAIDVTTFLVEPFIAINVTRGKEAEVMCESTWWTKMENEYHNGMGTSTENDIELENQYEDWWNNYWTGGE